MLLDNLIFIHQNTVQNQPYTNSILHHAADLRHPYTEVAIVIDLTRLKAFIFAAETLSFSEASKRLHLTQPTISHHIKNLESDLEVTLFERKGNKLILTEAGKMLVPWVRKLLRQSNEIKEMMISVNQEAVGYLDIACSTASGKYVLPHLAARFRDRFPGVFIRILPCAPENLVSRLLENQAHLGAISSEMTDQSMEYQTLYIDTINLIVPIDHHWVGNDPINASQILEEKIIMREISSGTRKVVMTELLQSDINYDDLNVFMELGNAEGIVEIVAAGHGIAFVSSMVAKPALESGRIATVNIKDLTMHRQVFLVRKAIHSPHRVT
ncbi:MAG TPA: LysR family transcriptional regulator, partial [Anaerolineales bacterium]|nr:LysR family transcriptional regulator [Anaerolineales bacterium]